MKKLLFPFALFALLLTSCLGDETDKNEVTQQFSGLMANVTNDNGASRLSSGMTMEIVWNYNNTTADVSIEGLKLADGTEQATMRILGLPITGSDDGWLLLTTSKADVEVDAGVTPAVTNFRLKYADRYVDGSDYVAAYLAFDLNGTTHVVAGMPNQIFFGTTASQEINSGTDFESTVPQYVINVDVYTGKLKIGILDNVFYEQMSPVTMLYTELPFTISGSVISWSVPETAAYDAANVKFSDVKVTNLSGAYDLSTGMFFSYDITVPGAEEGDPEQEYSVSFDSELIEVNI